MQDDPKESVSNLRRRAARLLREDADKYLDHQLWQGSGVARGDIDKDKFTTAHLRGAEVMRLLRDGIRAYNEAYAEADKLDAEANHA